MNKDPIFIVGAQRSGTTLLAAILAAHSRLSCGPETHFFRRLSKADPSVLTDPESWPNPALDFICSITRTNYPSSERYYLIDKYQLSKDDIRRYLEPKDPAISNILSSITEQYMEMKGKNRWVEKTPDHIEYLQDIRKYFPNSPIVRILRDPRDIAMSLMKVPWGAKTLFEALMYWKDLDDASAGFFTTDLLSYTLRFEDLVSSPVDELQKLCQFIAEPYEETMLDTSETGKQLNISNVPWKDKVSSPVDSGRSYAWRKEMTPLENQLAEAVLGDRISVYGYPREASFDQYGELLPRADIAFKYSEALAKLAAKGIRFWKANQDEKPSALIYLGDPGRENWLDTGLVERVSSSISITIQILKAMLNKKNIFWLVNQEGSQWSGFFSFWLQKLLSPHRVSLANSGISN